MSSKKREVRTVGDCWAVLAEAGLPKLTAAGPAGDDLFPAACAVAKLLDERDRLRAAVVTLRDVGAGLANVAYNLGQSTRFLSDDERPILADLAKRWDAATLDAKRALDAADPTAPPDPAPIAAFDVDAEAARVADAVVDAFTNGDELSTAPAEALRKAHAQGRNETREALARWAKHHGHLGPGEIRTLPLDEAPHA